MLCRLMPVGSSLSRFFTRTEKRIPDGSFSRSSTALFTILSLAVISIDDFALIGKQYGDLCIEDCFRAMTRAISQVIRDVDIAARLERDRVVVLFPETYSSRATICGARLCEKIKKEIINDKLRFLQVTASVGVVSFPTHGREGDDLLNKAVEFLHCAQERGGNQAHTE